MTIRFDGDEAAAETSFCSPSGRHPADDGALKRHRVSQTSREAFVLFFHLQPPPAYVSAAPVVVFSSLEAWQKVNECFICDAMGSQLFAKALFCLCSHLTRQIHYEERGDEKILFGPYIPKIFSLRKPHPFTFPRSKQTQQQQPLPLSSPI